MIAEGIASGHVTAADVCFLIAVIVFVLAAVLSVRVKMVYVDLVATGTRRRRPWVGSYCDRVAAVHWTQIGSARRADHLLHRPARHPAVM